MVRKKRKTTKPKPSKKQATSIAKKRGLNAEKIAAKIRSGKTLTPKEKAAVKEYWKKSTGMVDKHKYDYLKKEGKYMKKR